MILLLQPAMHADLYALVLILSIACTHRRSSILTGKYVHNHKTFENSVASGCASESWRQLNEEKTIGAYMSAAGYNTGFFGGRGLQLQCRVCVCVCD